MDRLRQDCIMSMRLFIIFFDRVVRPVSDKAMGEGSETEG